MSAADHAKAIASFLKKLPKGDVPEPPDDRDPVAELVYSFLLWESTSSRADNAFKRVQDQFVDFNDLRVSRPVEVAMALGKTYPLLDERIMRLQAVLKDVYVRTYEVSLAHLADKSKRDVREELRSLEGMPAFVASRVMLFSFGGHAIPVEERLLKKLVEAGVLDDGTDVEKAQGVLERYIKAEDGRAAYLKLQHFSEAAAPARKTTTQRKATTRKKATTQKKAAKKAPAKKATTARKTTTRKKTSSAKRTAASTTSKKKRTSRSRT